MIKDAVRSAEFLNKLAELMVEYDIESFDAQPGHHYATLDIDVKTGGYIHFDTQYVDAYDLREKAKNLVGGR